jgi:mono/diheme cytochrome c family protein
MSRLAGLLLALLFGAAAAGGAWYVLGPEGVSGTIRIDADDRALVARGRAIYAEHCAACHGGDLEGQPDWRRRRPDGRLPAPPHDETGHTWHHPDWQLFEMTKYGMAAQVDGDYESDMPAYEGILADDEIIAVLAYIKSRWPDQIRRRQEEITRVQERR